MQLSTILRRPQQVIDWRTRATRNFQKQLILTKIWHVQNIRHFADQIIQCIFWNKDFGISIKALLKLVYKDQIDPCELMCIDIILYGGDMRTWPRALAAG